MSSLEKISRQIAELLCEDASNRPVKKYTMDDLCEAFPEFSARYLGASIAWARIKAGMTVYAHRSVLIEWAMGNQDKVRDELMHNLIHGSKSPW